MTVRLILEDEAATERLGQLLAGALRTRDVITLSGPLGSGKTVLARGFIRALVGADAEVPSPTFTLVQTYDVAAGMIWHLDLYRLERPDEVWELGFEEALSDVAMLIEWPERLGSALPARRLDVVLSAGATPDQRIATLTSWNSDLLTCSGLTSST